MEYHSPGLHLRCKIKCPPAVAQPLFLLMAMPGRHGRFEQVWRGIHHASGQRTEIVGRTDLDQALVEGFEYPRHEGDADAMAQFHVRETQTGDFLASSRGRHCVARSTTQWKVPEWGSQNYASDAAPIPHISYRG